MEKIYVDAEFVVTPDGFLEREIKNGREMRIVKAIKAQDHDEVDQSYVSAMRKRFGPGHHHELG